MFQSIVFGLALILASATAASAGTVAFEAQASKSAPTRDQAISEAHTSLAREIKRKCSGRVHAMDDSKNNCKTLGANHVFCTVYFKGLCTT